MEIFSYKHHLQLLEEQKQPKFIYKTLLLTFAAVILTLGFFSSLFYYQYKKDEPLRAQNQYLQFLSGGFGTTRQSLSETIESYQVAGARVKFIDSIKEATPQAAGYYASLDDVEKSITKIDTLQKNIRFQRNQLKKEIPPQDFKTLSGDMAKYYETSIQILESLQKEQQFASQMLKASGLSFYLPTLTNEILWVSKDVGAIKAYYESKKIEANTALAQLSGLTVPQEFKLYYNNQIAFLTLFVESSNKIIDTLNKEDDKNPDVATQIEQAYQILNHAKKDNEKISQQLLLERLKVFDTKRNLDKFAQINLMSLSLGSRINQLVQVQEQPKTDRIYQAIITKLNRFIPDFLPGLQIGTFI